MKQRALTIVSPILPGTDLDVLEDFLHGNGGGWQGGGQGPFACLSTLHYLSCCVIRPTEGESALLVLELDFDGREGVFLTELVRSCRGPIDLIFESCDGYPGPTARPPEIVEFLRRRRHRENLFYLGHPGRSVQQIREENALRPALRAKLARVRKWKRLDIWGELRSGAPATKPPRLPFLVRYSLNGWRGPRRALELVRVFAWIALLLVGIAAFCGFAISAWRDGDHFALASALIAASIVPLLLCIAVFRLRPRHLKPMGAWLALREVASQGASAFVYSAVVVGFVAALLPGASEQWLKFSVWEFLAAAAPWAIGLVISLVLIVVSIAIAYVLAGWVLVLVAVAFSLWVMVAGFVELLQQPIGVRELLAFGVPMLAALFVVMVVVGVSAIYLPLLRRREAGDAVAPVRWDNAHLARMTEDEDRQFQNHFASVTIVKDGMRLFQLRWMLRLIHLLGKIYYNQGSLGSIPSIHFARFIVLKERGRVQKRLLFLTNYDGGWANYLGEFSHVTGVTLVWGSTEGFPRPFLLARDGSRDEQRFKTWARASQIKTLIWYSAYPELSVVQVNRNTRVRSSLRRPLAERPPRLGPLLRLWRAFRQPLDEAALDDALRSLTN